MLPPIRIGLLSVRVEPMPAEHIESKLGQWQCDPADGLGPLIRISERQPPAMRAATLLHEILHVGAWLVGSDDDEQGRLCHEQWIDLASNTIATVMRDNPHLVAWLTEQLSAT